MANSKDKQEEKKEALEANQKTLASKSREKPARNYLAILSLIVAVIAIATALYTIQLNQQLHQNFNEQKNQMVLRLDELGQQQNTIESSVSSTGQNLKDTEKEIQDRLKGLHKQFQLTIQQREYDNQDWMLLKARYYLELAQINAHWSDSNNTTIALLKQADMILANISTQDVFKIRQAIAKEIALLNASSQLDTAGLLSQLDAMNQTISKLPLATLPASKASTAAIKKTNTKAWKERLQDSVSVLEKLVVIRHHDEDIKPLLSPVYVAVVRENIRLNLQQAQWAVLKRNNEIYQMAINEAIMNVQRNFDPNASASKDVLIQLTHLKTLNLHQPRPKLALSLPLLNQLIDQKQTSPEKGKQPARKGERSS